MKLQLQRDWTLAHFLSYIAGIGAVLLSIQLLFQIYMFTTPLGVDFPIKYSLSESAQINSVTNNGFTFRPSSQQSGLLVITNENTLPTIHSFLIYFLKIFQSGLNIFFVYLLWRFFKSVANNQSFTDENYKRLFAMGWIYILTDFFNLGKAIYLDWLTNDAFQLESFDISGYSYGFSNLFIIGIVIIVLGYVFREGHRIHEEQQLTV